LRLFSFGGYGLALAALALVVFGAIERTNDCVFYSNSWRTIAGFAEWKPHAPVVKQEENLV